MSIKKEIADVGDKKLLERNLAIAVTYQTLAANTQNVINKYRLSTGNAGATIFGMDSTTSPQSLKKIQFDSCRINKIEEAISQGLLETLDDTNIKCSPNKNLNHSFKTFSECTYS